MNAKTVTREVEKRLREHADPAQAVEEKRYLKSNLDFLGMGIGTIRKTVADAIKQRGPLEHDDVVALAAELWRRPLFERRMAAVVLLEHNSAMLEGSDLPLLENLVRQAGTWALVDPLATKVLGDMTVREASVRRAMDTWANDPDFWIRRSSLLAEMKSLKEGRDFSRFAARADTMLEEKEFFIRKAIGWGLRELSKSSPTVVYEWLLPRAARLSGVTMREAVKYLDKEQQDDLAQIRAER